MPGAAFLYITFTVYLSQKRDEMEHDGKGGLRDLLFIQSLWDRHFGTGVEWGFDNYLDRGTDQLAL